MLQFLFFGTRICRLNFHTMWVLPVLALAALLVFRLFWGGRQPCKGLMWVLPAAYVLTGVGNAFLLAADNTALVSLTSLLFGLEPVLLFAWLGLLLGTVIAALLPKKEKKETGNA